MREEKALERVVNNGAVTVITVIQLYSYFFKGTFFSNTPYYIILYIYLIINKIYNNKRKKRRI